MFLKKGNKILIGFVCFFIGCIISYSFSQYVFFNITYDFNVVELLLSLLTVGIGFYIAFVLEKNRNKSQNFYQYVESKYDLLWRDFIQFSDVLESSDFIELKETSKWFKTLYRKLTPLIKIFESFKYDKDCLTKIEEKLEELDEFISNNDNIENQILNLTPDNTIIIDKLNAINELFASSFKDLSNI
jgi:hypothetical protein